MRKNHCCDVFCEVQHKICYNTSRQFNSFAFWAMLTRVKPGKLSLKSRWPRLALWAHSPLQFLQGLSRASLETRRGMRPLFHRRETDQRVGSFE